MKLRFPTVATVRTIATTAAVAFLLSSQSQAQNLYNATTLPANPQAGVVNYLQQITLAGGTGTFSLTSFQLGINFTTGTTDDYGVLVSFYTGLNTSPSATDVLASATQIGGVSGTLDAPGSSGNFTYTFTLNSPLSLAVTGPIGVQVQLTTSGFDFYSTDMNGRFSTVAPTTGSALNYVWTDSNGNGTFQGSEQTTFGQSGAYIRFSMTGTAPTVPEPSTWALSLTGLGLVVFAMRRRLA